MLSKFSWKSNGVVEGWTGTGGTLFLSPHKILFSPQAIYICPIFVYGLRTGERYVYCSRRQLPCTHTAMHIFMQYALFIFPLELPRKIERPIQKSVMQCVHKVGGHLCMVLTWTFVQCWCWYRGAFGKSESLPDHPATSSLPRFVLFICQIRENLS